MIIILVIDRTKIIKIFITFAEIFDKYNKISFSFREKVSVIYPSLHPFVCNVATRGQHFIA
jgi:hypothetical protein